MVISGPVYYFVNKFKKYIPNKTNYNIKKNNNKYIIYVDNF